MTFFTFGAKCPARGASGFAGSSFTDGAGAGAATPSCASNWLRAIAPTPTPHWPKKCRRVADFRLEISEFGSGMAVIGQSSNVLKSLRFGLEHTEYLVLSTWYLRVTRE